MKLLLVDYDGTLADINEFKKKIQTEIAEQCHTDPETIRLLIKSLFTAYGIIDWEPFYEKTMQLSSLSREEIKKYLYEPMKYITLQEPVISYIKNFEGYKVLYSYGEYEFQSTKIKLSGADRLVDSVWITQTPKTQALSEKIRNNKLEYNHVLYEDITIIDDNKTFLQEAAIQFPFINIINVIDLL